MANSIDLDSILRDAAIEYMLRRDRADATGGDDPGIRHHRDWTCPVCSGRYSGLDGVRYFTKSQCCDCEGMPAQIRELRAARDRRLHCGAELERLRIEMLEALPAHLLSRYDLAIAAYVRSILGGVLSEDESEERVRHRVARRCIAIITETLDTVHVRRRTVTEAVDLIAAELLCAESAGQPKE